MRRNPSTPIYQKRLSYAVSVALASLMASNSAAAQENKPAPAAESEITQVLVVGTRASQQSAIDRKKNAATAMDSIIAEDVGAFPDRNIAEAISRISGVALDRGEYGEGVNVSVRGNGPDMTRVELDGQGVQAGGGTDLNGGGEGRGVELRELSSDLIKSVDVVKGSTAEMTEGGLGGSIIIKTRTGLDFKKPYYSLRLGAAQTSLNKEITPDLNLVLANKFLDNRLGVILNANASKASNEFHNITGGGGNSNQGLIRNIDFDNSPEKTFSFNPDFLSNSDPSVDSRIPVTNVPDNLNFALTPRDILTRSGAAKTKADCYAAFPALTAAQVASLPSNGRTNAINQNSNELSSCLNQWNDYTPFASRLFTRQQKDERKSLDLRFDYKISSDLSVYAKINTSKRDIEEYNSSFGLGGLSINPAGSFVDSAAGVRTAVPNSGYFTNPYSTSFRSGLAPAKGAVTNAIPGSVVVDDSHHVTSFSTTSGTAGVDAHKSDIDTSTQYLQGGGSYRNGGFRAEFLIGDARSDMTRIEKRISVGQPYGESTQTLLPNGLWNYSFPANTTFDLRNAANYALLSPQAASTAQAVSVNVPVAIPAYTSAQKPLVTSNTLVNMQHARRIETSEKTAKLDLSYALSERVPFFTTVKGGFNLRDTRNKNWNNNGRDAWTLQEPLGTYGTPAYVPGIYLPTANPRSTVIGCENTPGSLGTGGQPCKYGFNQNTAVLTAHGGQMVMTQAQYQDLIAKSMTIPPNSQFYASAKDRPSNLTDGWYSLDIDKFVSLSGLPGYDAKCMKECMASDGKVYAQPYTQSKERTSSGYFMTEFALDHLPFSSKPLPFGMELDGNMGVRYVKVNAQATAMLKFTTIETVDGVYDPNNPTAANGIVSKTYTKNTTIQSDTTDLMPIYNLALWVVPSKVVVRYNHAKTIARPPISKMNPSGTCFYDERIIFANEGSSSDDAADQRCSGTMGNPALKPFTNSNRNLSVEWYANKDTMFTVAGFKQVGRIGAPTFVASKLNQKIFAGSDAVDPTTGKRLADLEFSFNQWENQPASTRKGLEFGTKTAFTFLPWLFRNTGLDANYTRVRSSTTAATIRDLLTGEALPVAGEPKYSYNSSLWYDDGKFSARIALQVVAPVFTCIQPCGLTGNQNNFPADGATVVRAPYNPGSPNFKNETRYVDAKMAYRFDNGIELFLEGRNLGLSRQSVSQGGYNSYSDGTEVLHRDNFNGAKIMVGVNIRSL